MAKVMVSLPDDLLDRLDQRAREDGTTRSGLLQQLARAHLASASDERAATIRRLLADPGRHGGSGTQAVRDSRRAR